MELYKYCKNLHHDALLTRGALRVGTLYDYRRTDVFGERVADKQEGKKVLGGVLTHLTAESELVIPGIKALRQAGLINIDLSHGGTIEHLTIESAVSESPNLLLFSTSTEYSNKTHEHWNEAEGYDACYKITSARLFFRAISNVLGVGYSFLGFGSVIYEDRIDLKDPRCHVHPAMVKRRSEFFGQAEVRGVWKSNDTKDLAPVLVDTSGAALYAMPYRRLQPVGA